MSGTNLEKETLLPWIRKISTRMRKDGQTDGKTKIIQMLELADRGFRSIIKNAAMKNFEHALDKWKNGKFQQRNGNYKEEPKENFRTEKYNKI